ncbi:MAG TPA: hypothetical protein VI754_11460 [Bacteriovoracaceae bacterium]|nr:hypothetical protein [Bacteriovoracaceae bacterium]
MEKIREELKTKIDTIKTRLEERSNELGREEMQILLFSLLLEEEQNAGPN